MINIRVQNVVKLFGETRALNNVSLEIEPGELFFLLGPSGCGKTTLLRSLAGFYIPEEGSISFGDKDVTRLEPHKRNTGMMFQSYALWPHMSVRENVAFGLEQRKVSKEEILKRADEALDNVKMLEYADRKPNQLSGGQQQRVALARALVIRPACLLLDEPLSNLDAKLRNEMRLEIRRICKEFKLTTVYVTHDQKEALSIADRMAVMDRGNILQVGSPLDVYKRPRNRFVANFIGDSNFIPGTVLDCSLETGEAHLDTPLGKLTGVLSRLDSDSAPPAGAEVDISIRPECIRFTDNPKNGNHFGGNIGSSVYYGEVAHYDLNVGNHKLHVSELNPRHVQDAAQAEVTVEVDPEDVILLES